MPKLYVKRHAVTQPTDPSYRLIPLTQGQNAIVDTADYEWLNSFNWHAQWNKPTKSFYARRHEHVGKRYQAIQMASQILKCKPGEVPDHKNHDTLDNRRNNIRKATCEQNLHNQGIRSTNTSGYKGVFWRKDRNRWIAVIKHKGKIFGLGSFMSRKKAARAWNKAAKRIHGEFIVLNQI